MTLEALRKYHQAEPFRPFVLHMADGRSVRVDHPEFLAYTGGGRTIIVGDAEGDGSEIVDLLLVASIQVLDSRRRRNGRGRAA
jgi:hypothetical protein